MKKAVFLPVFALAVLVSHSWAVQCKNGTLDAYCQWEGGCYKIDDEYGEPKGLTCAQYIAACEEDGDLYTGVDESQLNAQYGKDQICSEIGGTYAGPVKKALGCCKWDGETQCYTIWDTDEGAEKKVKDCNGGTNRFWEGACVTNIDDKCPSSTPVHDGLLNSCGEYYCYWAANADGGAEGCFKIMKEEGKACDSQITNCRSNSLNKKVYSDANCTVEIPASSSSSVPPSGNSSSSVTYYDYCILANGTCLKVTAPEESCRNMSGGGTPTNTDCRSSSSATAGGSSSSSATSGGSSSSSTTGGGSSSSSSAETSGAYDYCKIGELCAEGPYTYEECRGMDGIPMNSCTTPIIVLPKPVQRNSVIAMQNAVNLQITGSAAIQIFDLKGNTVRSMKFAQGNYVVPLSDLPRGLYIVKASNASWRQTIKVTVR